MRTATIDFDSKELLSNAKYEINFEKTLFKAVEEQMISDVPIGAFLSGGIDSLLIVSIMQSISSLLQFKLLLLDLMRMNMMNQNILKKLLIFFNFEQ